MDKARWTISQSSWEGFFNPREAIENETTVKDEILKNVEAIQMHSMSLKLARCVLEKPNKFTVNSTIHSGDDCLEFESKVDLELIEKIMHDTENTFNDLKNETIELIKNL